MPRQNHTDVIVVLDRSGSMSSVVNDVIGGYNTFVQQQRLLPGTANLSLYIFDTTLETVHENCPIHQVPTLSEAVYFARGGTALLDAVGSTIDRVGARLSATAEENRPERVLFCINTDGEENASREYSAENVRSRIQHQQDVYKWAFLFMGADQNAWHAGATLGLSYSQTMSYDKAQAGSTFSVLNDATTLYRHSGTVSLKSNDIRTNKGGQNA